MSFSRVGLSLLALLMPAGAVAQELAPSDYGWFLRPRAIAGASDAPGSFSTLPPGTLSSDQESYRPQENFGVGLGLGYRGSAWGVPFRALVDGSLNFRHDTDIRATLPGGAFADYENNLRIWDVRLTLLADVLRFGWGNFYAGGGLGAAYVENDVGISRTPTEVQSAEWKVSPSLEAGLVLDGLFRRVVPEISYRFRWIGDTESGTFPTGEALDYRDLNIHEIALGFTVPLQPSGSSMASISSPTPLAYDWTGFHIGATAGWGFGDFDVAPLTDPLGAPYNPGPGFSFDGDGFFGTAQVGVDRQWKWFVLGLGAEAGVLALDQSQADPSSAGGDTVTTVESDFYAGITARGGVALDRLLIYGKGGVMFANATARAEDDCASPPCGLTTLDASEEDILFGVSAGGGVEYAFSQRLSAGLEYRWLHLFDDLQPEGTASTGVPYSDVVTINDIHTLRGAINYRW